MLFNSLAFLTFFFVVYTAYLVFSSRPNVQNILLVAASYYFYGHWDYRFCFLLAGTTAVQYALGHAIHRAAVGSRRRKALVTLAVSLSLAMLGTFKYLDFFADSLNVLLAAMGASPALPLLKLILPVGMSFYTFKEIAYVVDIYRQDAEPARSPIAFALYIAFFPQLIAGPIERAREMLPQITRVRRIEAEDVEAGMHLIAWGLFKKSVVADNLARKVVDPIFASPSTAAGLDLTLAVVAYTFQIYCDFSGYSDMARGLARLMGFKLPLNFALPYFAADPSEFWRRWHITLSSWLRDYLYVPLGGNRGARWATYRNLMLTMLLGGLWHGAAWHYVAWGAFHGLLLAVYRLPPLSRSSTWRGIRRWVAVAVMFTLTALGWVLFRADDWEHALTILSSASLRSSMSSSYYAMTLGLLVAPVLAFETLQERSGNLLNTLRWRLVPKTVFYASVLGGITLFAVRERTEFIYFQF